MGGNEEWLAAFEARALAERMNPRSPVDLDRSRLADESPASQEWRAAMYARERELARRMIDDPLIDDLEFSYRLTRLTYADVKGLARIQMREREGASND